MKKTKKLLSIVLSICMLFSITASLNFTAEAAMTTRDKVITSNVNKIKSYIKQNGFINGNGDYTYQHTEYSDDYNYYFLMIVNANTDKLSFKVNMDDAQTDDLINGITMDLSNPTNIVKYVDAYRYEKGYDYSVVGGHAYVGANYHDNDNNIAFYIDYNDIDANEPSVIELFDALSSYAFSMWNEMLNDELGMNLGAIGFTKYCTEHSWNSGEVTKKSTPTATGVKTYTCTLCGTTKTASIPKCAKYENPMTAKGKTATLKYAKLKTKKLTLASKKTIKLSKAQGTVTYKKTSGNKKISVNKKTGKITVKKGLKKGTYKVKIKVTAAGNASYKAKVKTVTVKIKVK